MEIFQDADYIYSDVYGDFYEDNFLRAIVAIPEDRDLEISRTFFINYESGSTDAAVNTKNMRM